MWPAGKKRSGQEVVELERRRVHLCSVYLSSSSSVQEVGQVLVERLVELQ
jgi:hypothetical protein